MKIPYSASVRAYPFSLALLGCALLAGCSTSTEAASGPNRSAIPAGTQIVARTTSTLSTELNSEGSPFTAILVTPLRAGDRILASAGTQVDGVVVHTGPGTGTKGRAAIGLKLSTLRLDDGRAIPIASNTHWRAAPDTNNSDTFATGAISGRAVILAGSPIAFRLVQPIALQR